MKPFCLRHYVLNLPLVFVAECLDGFFGGECDRPCHCLDDAVCRKDNGRCPTSCDRGWKGDDCQLGEWSSSTFVTV